MKGILSSPSIKKKEFSSRRLKEMPKNLEKLKQKNIHKNRDSMPKSITKEECL